jgi:predicted ATPase
MYMFGIVVTGSDDTPMGRASAALRVQLPTLFPEHGFQFLDLVEVPELQLQHLFRVLASEIRNDADEVVISSPSDALVETVQAEVDKIVETAGARGVN